MQIGLYVPRKHRVAAYHPGHSTMQATAQPRSDSSVNSLQQARRMPRAQAMVEFALALPIFLLVVYGLLEAGRLIFTIASVTNAAREAVRYASADGLISSNPSNTTLNYNDCTGIRATAKKVGFLLGLLDNNILIYWDNPAVTNADGTPKLNQYCSPGTTVDSITLQPGYRVWVKVGTQFTALLPLTPFSSRWISSGNTARTFMGIIDLAPTATPAS